MRYGKRVSRIVFISLQNADAAQLCTALRNIHDLLNDLDPRLRPFISMCYLQAKVICDCLNNLTACCIPCTPSQ